MLRSAPPFIAPESALGASGLPWSLLQPARNSASDATASVPSSISRRGEVKRDIEPSWGGEELCARAGRPKRPMTLPDVRLQSMGDMAKCTIACKLHVRRALG